MKNHGTTSAQGLGSSGLSHGKLRRFTDTQRRPRSAAHAAENPTYAIMARMRLPVTLPFSHALVAKSWVVSCFRRDDRFPPDAAIPYAD